jgi:hypothetical protein
MGIKLMVEVLDYAPMTLTHREKLLLVVLAEDARDATRRTWNSIEDPKILRRAKVSRSQLYEIVKALIAKDVLKKEQAGQKNGTAKYVLLPLGPQCPEIPDTDESQCPENPDTEPASQSPENRDTDESQCPGNRDVSVPESGTPTPHPLSSLSPQSTSAPPTPPAAPDERETPAAPQNHNSGRQIDNQIHNDQAQQVSAAWTAARGGRRNPKAERAVAEAAAELLAAGWALADTTALAEDMARRQPTYTDLAKHEPYWRPAKPGRPLAVVPEPTQLPSWCADLDCDKDTRIRAVTDADGFVFAVPCPDCHPDTQKAAA